MKTRVAFGVLMSLAAAGCRIDPSSPDLANTAAGKACPPDAEIENAEDGNNQIFIRDGRSGYVYTDVDSVGSTVSPKGGAPFAMADGGANGSAKAMRIVGRLAPSGEVRAALGLNFTDPLGPYDASKYRGISFYAKKGEGSTGKVAIRFPDKNTDPGGGICAKCYNAFGLTLSLTTDWQRYIVPFDALKQEPDWGSPRPRAMASEEVYAVQFAVADPGRDFDIWIDDIAFTGCP